MYKWCGISGLASTVKLKFSVMLYFSVNVFHTSCAAVAVI